MKKLFIATFLFAALCTHAQDPAYPPAPAAPLNIVKAEYFIDADPGFGAGTAIPLIPATDIAGLAATINTGALTAGAHKLFVRILNAEGRWSIASVRQFVADFDPLYPAVPPAVQNITKAEYFIDTDPGFGNGINIPLTAAADIAGLAAVINTSLLAAGAHKIYVRSRNNEGRWSFTSFKQFIVNDDPAYPSSPSAPGNITFAEYFFDTDPGFGNGTAVALTPGADISNLGFAANTAALTAGTHNLYIRSLDDWSITSVRPFDVAVILPLRFIHFTAAATDDKVVLSWRTGDELNTSHFDVERSTDGIAFTKIASIAAANSGGQHDYMQADQQPGKGINYYRIKQVDKDGRFTYTGVIRISFNSNPGLLTVYPNPAATYIMLDITAAGKKLQVKIYDIQGRLVSNEQLPNTQPFKIDIQKLAAGKYLVIVGDGDEIERGIFMKQ